MSDPAKTDEMAEAGLAACDYPQELPPQIRARVTDELLRIYRAMLAKASWPSEEEVERAMMDNLTQEADGIIGSREEAARAILNLFAWKLGRG